MSSITTTTTKSVTGDKETKSKSFSIHTLVVSCVTTALITTGLLNSMRYATLDHVVADVSLKNINFQTDSGAVVSGGSVNYIPSTLEAYVYQNSVELGLHHTTFSPSGCYLWDDTVTMNTGHLLPTEEEKKQLKRVPAHIRQQYLDYKKQLREHYDYISKGFQLQLPYIVTGDGVTSTTDRYTDIRQALRVYNHDQVCDAIHVPWDTTGTNDTSLLSHIQPTSSGSGGNKNIPDQLMEPLLPPLRHLDMCFDKPSHLFDMNYIVHDFQYICKTMTPYTRTVFVDMGASLLFHANENPAIAMAKLYEKFGIVFDHVYAFEMTSFSAEQTKSLFSSLIPELWRTSYHWMNVGVDSTVDSPLNPFTMIKQHFSPEDFIVVKLDVDTPSVELPLAQELLNDPQLNSLVDQFYFEYHVKLKELNDWGDSVEGSIYDALHLLTQMREKGIASHFWV